MIQGLGITSILENDRMKGEKNSYTAQLADAKKGACILTYQDEGQERRSCVWMKPLSDYKFFAHFNVNIDNAASLAH